MTTLKTVIKRSGGYTGCAGYIYRNGIWIVNEEKFRGQKIKVNYWLPKEIKFTDPDLGRVVLHHADEILPFGVPERISTYRNNKSEIKERIGIESRLVSFHYKHGGIINFSENKFPDSYGYHNPDITAQGIEYWAEDTAFPIFKTKEEIDQGFVPTNTYDEKFIEIKE